MECHQCYVWICVFTAILFPLVLIGFSTEIIEEAEEPIEHDEPDYQSSTSLSGDKIRVWFSESPTNVEERELTDKREETEVSPSLSTPDGISIATTTVTREPEMPTSTNRITTTTRPDTTQNENDEWEEIQEGLEVKLVSKEVGFFEALLACHEFGGRLFEPRDPEIAIKVNDIVLTREDWSDSYWVGIADYWEEGRFVFVSDGADPEWTNWSKLGGYNQPDNFLLAEDFVEILLSGEWNDVPASLKRPFVCEHKPGVYFVIQAIYCWTVGSENHTVVPAMGYLANNLQPILDDWTVLTETLAISFEPEALTHFEAAKRCSKKGGRLYEPWDQEEYNLVIGNLMVNHQDWTEFWIGLSDFDEEGRFVYESTGEDIQWSNWHQGIFLFGPEPNNFLRLEDHVEVLVVSGKWNDISGSEKIPSICELAQGPSFDGPEVSGSWETLETGNGKEVAFIEDLKSYNSALGTCLKMGGKLLEPKESNTLEQVSNIVKRRYQWTRSWIGITDTYEEGHFVYHSNNEPVTFENWGPGQPNSDFPTRDFAMAFMPSGHWETRDGLFNYAGFVCEKTDLWIEMAGSSFVIHPWISRFNESVEFCNSQGGQLFEPRNLDEIEAVASKMKEFGIAGAFVGIREMGVEGEFRYLSDKEVFDHDSLWYEGEPNNVGDNGENVGMIYSEGHFNDIHEEYVEYPSVCKKI